MAYVNRLKKYRHAAKGIPVSVIGRIKKTLCMIIIFAINYAAPIYHHHKLLKKDIGDKIKWVRWFFIY